MSVPANMQTSQSPASDPGAPALTREIATYRRELPRLLEEGYEGKYALIKGDAVRSIWDTRNDAGQAAHEHLAGGEPFRVQPIAEDDLTRPFPEELGPGSAEPIAGRTQLPLPWDRGLLTLQQEIKTYRRELPRLLREGHEGRFVLIQGSEVVSIWDTFDDVCQAAHQRFDGGEVFLTQPIDARDLTRWFPVQFDPDS